MGIHHHHHHDEASHSHEPHDFGRIFLIGILLNLLFITAEVVYGFASGSLALLADAGHNASDVLGLFLAWGAVILARRAASERYTYGLQSSTILTALANAMLLLVACGGIGLEAVQRFADPQPVATGTVMAVAALGIVVNGLTAWLFRKGGSDLNIRGAFLHMAADALVSLGVVMSAGLMQHTGWLWLDPVISLLIAAVIIGGTWGLLRDSVNLALHAVPKHVDIAEVRTYLTGLPEVKELHDLHIWAMSTNETALSAHLVMRDAYPGDSFLSLISGELEKRFHIGHSTLQVETGDGMDCRQCVE